MAAHVPDLDVTALPEVPGKMCFHVIGWDVMGNLGLLGNEIYVIVILKKYMYTVAEKIYTFTQHYDSHWASENAHYNNII